MANRDQSISEPTPKPSHASPHSLTPAGWDESAGFRETFLFRIDDPDDTAALRRVARLLHESSLELARPAQPGDEPATRQELRAAAADLRHLQGFLAAVARGGEAGDLSPADAELATQAARQAETVAGVAEVLEKLLV